MKSNKGQIEEDEKIARNFILEVVVLSNVAWNFGFNLGAFKTVFFNNAFFIWIACTAMLCSSFLVYPSRRMISPRGRLVLIFPSLYLLVKLLKAGFPQYWLLDHLIVSITIIVNLVCLPYFLYLILLVHHGNIFKSKARKLIVSLSGIVIMIGTLGFWIGANNYLFLSCEDFKVSGNDLPANCRQEKESVFESL